MLLLTIDHIPGTEFEALGLVDGSIVCSLTPDRSFVSMFDEIIGGEQTEYSKLLVKARQTAVERMMNAAELLHADAIISIRYTTSEVATNAAEVVAYGTAVKFK